MNPPSGPGTDIVVVDAFTSEAFRGNPAGVCILSDPADDTWMQNVAAEMRHAETAFTHPTGDGRWTLRWFTPAIEADLCGHATLATTHVLFRDGHIPMTDVVHFDTRSGELTARPVDDGRFELDFPRARWTATDERREVESALGVPVQHVVSTAVGAVFAFAELDDPDLVRQISPDQRAIAALGPGNIIVSALGPGGPSGPDTVSRVFAPAAGIPEDPVTGAAHCVVGPWFADRVGPVLRCHQASPRGGDLVVTVDGERVRLSGHTVETLRGRLLV